MARMFRRNQNPAVQHESSPFRDLVRNNAAVLVTGAAMAVMGAASGVAIGAQGSAHSAASAPKVSIYGDFCDGVKLSSSKKETACIVPAGSGHLVEPAQSIKMYAYVKGGSYDYKFNWKLNHKHVGSAQVYDFIAKNPTAKAITETLSVTVKDLKTNKVMNPYIKITVIPSHTAPAPTVSNSTTNNGGVGNTTTNITTPPPVTINPPSVTLNEAPTVANQGNTVVFTATILSQGLAPDTYNWTLPAGISSSNGDCMPKTPTCTITAPTVSQQTAITVYVSITDSESPRMVTSNTASASVTVNPPVIVPPPVIG